MLYLLLCLLLQQHLLAQTTDLYEVEIPAPSSNNSTLTKKLPEALEIILIRISGQKNFVVNNPEIKNIENAKKSINNYRFEQRACSLKPDETCYFLKTHFQKKVILSLIEQTSVKAWLGERPPSFADISIEENGNISLIRQPSRFADIIANIASKRGIPVLLPHYNIHEDRNQSAQVEQTLTVKITQESPSNWLISWQLYTPKSTYVWESSTNNPNDAIALSIETLADFMASQSPTNLSQKTEQTTFLKIQNITSYPALNTIVKTLRKQPGVIAADLSQIEGSTAYINLKHQDPIAWIIEKNPTLTPEKIDSFDESPLILNWQKGDASENI